MRVAGASCPVVYDPDRRIYVCDCLNSLDDAYRFVDRGNSLSGNLHEQTRYIKLIICVHEGDWNGWVGVIIINVIKPQYPNNC